MSGGFSFPPPPPPPPKPSADQPYQQQYGPPDRGRDGGRGYTRGGADQRGRDRGGRGGNAPFSGQPGRGRGVWQTNQPRGMNHSNFSPHGHHNYAGNPDLHDAVIHPHMQAFDSASHGEAGVGAPSRTAAGHKRKLDALRGPQSEKPKASSMQTAPPVPSFGAPILALAPSLPAKPTNGPTKLPGKALGLIPRPNDDAQDASDSEDDRDVDEEALYAELGDKLTFEHNGVVMSLKSQADLAAWKKERQKNWPTNARMAERYEERWRIGEERKRLLAAAEVLRPAPHWKSKERKAVLQHVPSDETEEVTGSQHAPNPDETAMREERLAHLRKKVAESEAKNREARARSQSEEVMEAASATHDTGDLTKPAQHSSSIPDEEAGAGASDPMDHGLEEDNNGLPDHDAPDPSSELGLNNPPDSESEDSAPEETTSKPTVLPAQPKERPQCKYFLASGYCRDGNACRYRHELPPRADRSTIRTQEQQRRVQKETPGRTGPGGAAQGVRKSIFQRLLEQEQDEEDKLALQVIKHLGKVGLFRASDVRRDG